MLSKINEPIPNFTSQYRDRPGQRKTLTVGLVRSDVSRLLPVACNDRLPCGKWLAGIARQPDNKTDRDDALTILKKNTRNTFDE